MCDEEFGETLHLKDLGRSQRTYGTCGTMPAWSTSLMSPTHAGLRQWASHGVKSNETMVGIALKYDLTIEDIRRCNNLWTNDALWPGQVLRIPIKSPTNFLSPPIGSSNDDETSSHSNKPDTHTSISANDKDCEFAGFTMANSSNSTSTLTSYSSRTSSNLSAAPSNSSRRNTKSSISSNQNSSSSEIGESLDDCPRSSRGASFQQRKKGKSPSSSRLNTSEKSTSDVTASEFLTRMDISIEATRRNLKKSSTSNAVVLS